jgi:hypothetical protein
VQKIVLVRKIAASYSCFRGLRRKNEPRSNAATIGKRSNVGKIRRERDSDERFITLLWRQQAEFSFYVR